MSDSGASDGGASNHHSLSTTPRISGQGDTLGTDRISDVESDRPIESTVLSLCCKVITVVNLICQGSVIGLVATIVPQQCYKIYESSKTSGIILEK